MDLQKFCDNKRAVVGYGGAWMYKDPSAGETLYHLLIPTDNVPFVNGTVDTFEIDSLNCRSKGMAEGKESLEQKDVEYMSHRDNVKRIEDLEGKVLDFLSLDKNYMGRIYSGTLKSRPNDITAEVNRATVTITPLSARSKTEMNCLPLIQDTLWFASEIPDKLYMGASDSAKTIDAKVDTEEATVKVTYDTEGVVTANWADGKLTITPTKAGSAIIYLTAEKSGMASWTTSVLVIVE